MAGTALTNLIIVLTTPLLTRLYTPEEFGVYSVFLSLLFTGTILVSLRYETAIPLPEDEDQAFHLLVLSIILAFIISALLCILFFFIPISQLLNVPELETYMWMLSLSLLGIGIFQAFNSCVEFNSINRSLLVSNIGKDKRKPPSFSFVFLLRNKYNRRVFHLNQTVLRKRSLDHGGRMND